MYQILFDLKKQRFARKGYKTAQRDVAASPNQHVLMRVFVFHINGSLNDVKEQLAIPTDQDIPNNCSYTMEKNELLSIKSEYCSTQPNQPLSMISTVQRVVPSDAESRKFLSPVESQTFLMPDSNGTNGDHCDDFNECSQLPSNFSNEWVLLPPTLCQIYLGETFSFFLKSSSLCQTEALNEVRVRIDMQLASNRVVNIADIKKRRLEPKESIDHILHHEVKEMGSNV